MNPYTSPIDPDSFTDPLTRRCAIEFNAAGFVHQANQYAQEKEAMSTTNADKLRKCTEKIQELTEVGAADDTIQYWRDAASTWRARLHERSEMTGPLTCLTCGAMLSTGFDEFGLLHLRCAECRTSLPTIDIKPDDADLAENLGERLPQPCHYCPNTNAIDGLCPSCLAREEADAATYYHEVPCTDCGELVTEPEYGDPYCEDCLLASIPEDVRAMSGITLPWAIRSALLALFLALTFHAPPGCTISGTTGEGFPQATCENGSTIYLDLDGSLDRSPGTWTAQ